MVITNPILLRVPTRLETARLIIRAPRITDAPASNEAVTESFNELHPWMSWAKTPPTPEDSRSHIREMAGKFTLRELMMFVMIDKERKDYIGELFVFHPKWTVPSFEIGYWVRTSMTGQGYMTEALNGITEYAFKHLKARRLYLHIDIRNLASIKVAERCGYVREGILRNERRDNAGRLCDMVLLARIIEETPTE